MHFPYNDNQPKKSINVFRNKVRTQSITGTTISFMIAQVDHYLKSYENIICNQNEMKV